MNMEEYSGQNRVDTQAILDMIANPVRFSSKMDRYEDEDGYLEGYTYASNVVPETWMQMSASDLGATYTRYGVAEGNITILQTGGADGKQVLRWEGPTGWYRLRASNTLTVSSNNTEYQVRLYHNGVLSDENYEGTTFGTGGDVKQVEMDVPFIYIENGDLLGVRVWFSNATKPTLYRSMFTMFPVSIA